MKEKNIYNEEEMKYTDEWELLERGKDFLRKKNVFSEIDKFHRFYNGNQWENFKSGGIEPIVFNIIKPIVKYKIGVINANGYEIIYTPNNFDNVEFQKEMEEICKKLNKYTKVIIEQQKIDKKARKVLKQAAITSEGILYFDYKDNEVTAEVVSKGNIFYGNENDDNIQDQPYILITFRRTVDEVRKEARENMELGLNNLKEEDLYAIIGDSDTQDQPGDYAKDEVQDMVTCVLKMYRKNGTIHIKKSTKTVCYEEERDTGLRYYPVAHFTWEDEEGSARGIGVVKSLIPNQLEINKTAMRRAIAVKLGAYPKLVANKSQIVNPHALMEVGTSILVQDQTVDDVRKAVGYLHPATMSSDSEKLQSELIINTRELEGASEVATGNINPEQASGRAILAVQQASRESLNEQVNKFKDFMEDVGRIMMDMWRTYSENGKTIYVEDEEGNIEVITISKTQLENLDVNITIEITPNTPYDKYAKELSLENLLIEGFITFEEYVNALPEDSAMPKGKLEEIIRKRREAQEQIRLMQNYVNQADLVLQGALQQASIATGEEQTIEAPQNIGGVQNDVSGM